MISPGSNKAAEINAAITVASVGTSSDVYLDAGTFYLEAPIVLKSGVTLVGVKGKTFLAPTFTGAADDVANSCVVMDGALNTSILNTTLAASVSKNSTSITVAAAGTITAGDWILISGHNDPGAPQDALNESNGSSVVLYELIKVDSSYVSGTTIPLAWETRMHHGSNNCTVKAITPVIGAGLKDVRILGSEGSVTTANGLFARYCVECYDSGLQVSGCSRFAIDVIGCRDYSSSDFLSRGTNNGWGQFTSNISLKVKGYSGKQGVARVHSAGYPRYPILFRSRNTDVDVDDIHLTGTAVGMYISGGEHIRIGDVEITDVRITTAIYDRMVTSGEIDSGAPVFLGFGTGYGPLAAAEFGFDCTINSIRVEDVLVPSEAFWTATTPLRARAVYLHDVLSGHVGTISVINRGVTGDTHLVSGVELSDYSGHIDSISVAGYIYGLTFSNSSNSIVVDRYDFKGGGGTTPNSTIPILCLQTAPSAQSITLKYVSIANASSAFRTGGSFVGDYRFKVEHLVIDGNEWKDCVIVRNESATDFATGDIVELDSTSTVNDYVKVISPNTGDAEHEFRLFAIATGDDVSGANYMLGCSLPCRLATVMATTAAVTKGRLMKYTATRRCVADAAAAHPIGKALDYKAAGAEGLIRVTLPTP